MQLGGLAVTPLDAAALGAIARRARRLGARLGRLAATDRRQRHERVPAARAGADRVRGGGGRCTVARAGAARTRPRRPPRARSPCGSPPHRWRATRGMPRSLRPSSSRASASRSSPSPTARRCCAGKNDEARFAVPASFVLSEDLSQLVPVLHGAPLDRYPGATTPVLRLSGNVPSGTTFAFLGVPADRRRRPSGGWRRDFASEPLASLAARDHAEAHVALRSTALPAGRQLHAARDRERRRHRRAGALPLAARRLRGCLARPHERRNDDRAARPHPVHRRNARPAPARHPEQRPPVGERRARPAAEREGRGHASARPA